MCGMWIPKGKSEEEIAEEGLAAMEAWMKEIGVAMNIRETGRDGRDAGRPCIINLDNGRRL